MSFIILIVVGFAYDVTRRHVNHLRAQQGIPISEFGVSTYGFLGYMTIDRLKLIRLQVYKRARMDFFLDKHAAGTCFEMQVLVDKIWVPDWAFEAAVSQELRGMGQYVAAYQPGMYLTPAQEFNKHDIEPSNYINQWLQWLDFTKLVGITIRGSGTIDGNGAVWWQNALYEDPPIDSEDGLLIPLNNTFLERYPPIHVKDSLGYKMPSIKPTALRFYGSFNVTVTGIVIQNSPQCHLKFDNCMGVSVYNLTVSSPGDSPNTDGIHLQNSKDVLIRNSNLGCGDDCVSVQTGCTNVYIHDVNRPKTLTRPNKTD